MGSSSIRKRRGEDEVNDRKQWFTWMTRASFVCTLPVEINYKIISLTAHYVPLLTEEEIRTGNPSAPTSSTSVCLVNTLISCGSITISLRKHCQKLTRWRDEKVNLTEWPLWRYWLKSWKNNLCQVSNGGGVVLSVFGYVGATWHIIPLFPAFWQTVQL